MRLAVRTIAILVLAAGASPPDMRDPDWLKFGLLGALSFALLAELLWMDVARGECPSPMVDTLQMRRTLAHNESNQERPCSVVASSA